MYAIGQRVDETLTAWADRVMEETKDDGSPEARLLRVEAKLVQGGLHVVESAEGLKPRIEGSPVPPVDPEAAARVSAAKDQAIEDLTRQVAVLNDRVTEAQKDAGDLRMANNDLQTKLHDQQLALDAMTAERNQLQDKLANMGNSINGPEHVGS